MGITDSFFSLIGTVTQTIRDLINTIIPGNADIVLLALGGVGGYYLSKRYPNTSGFVTIVLYGLIIFLLLKFV